ARENRAKRTGFDGDDGTRCPLGGGETSLVAVLLSDRDIRAEVEAGRVRLDPFDDEMIQPASVDVRIDRYFRLFDNHKHALIDPSIEQPDLTREVAVDPDEAYMLHPGEFVLASTYEQITLPEDVAARLEGKSSRGRARRGRGGGSAACASSRPRAPRGGRTAAPAPSTAPSASAGRPRRARRRTSIAPGSPWRRRSDRHGPRVDRRSPPHPSPSAAAPRHRAPGRAHDGEQRASAGQRG